MITTTQLLIISLTALAVVFVIANTRRKIRAGELMIDVRRLEFDSADKARRLEQQRLDAAATGTLEVEPVVGPELGAKIAVHIDGRIIRGTLDHEDTSHRIVLTAATAFVEGGGSQDLGAGRQYLAAEHATQIQELS